MTIKVRISGKISVPRNMNFQKELEIIAERVIRPDIQKRMRKGIDINGKQHKANAPSTRINKGLRGLKTDVPLIASGQLLSSVRIALVGKNNVKLFPAGTRKPYPRIKSQFRLKKSRKLGSRSQPTNFELGDILQNKGVHGHKYNFFGISKEAENKAIRRMQSFIRKAIKNAR